MSYEKLLILESKWSDEVTDARSSTEIYTSIESLFSLHDEPVRIINRPLLSSLYLDDINQFVSLDANKVGPNVVIMAAHGSHTTIKKNGRRINRRMLDGFDGEINLSEDMQAYAKKFAGNLKRTIFILDSCRIGTNISGFLKVSKSYGVVGFSKEVDWTDSAVFTLALLLKFQQHGVFQLQTARKSNPLPERILNAMREGLYAPLMEAIGVRYKFSTKAQNG